MKEVTGNWRTLQNVQLLDLYPSSDVIRVIDYGRDGRGM
jgi:hypothetical protein